MNQQVPQEPQPAGADGVTGTTAREMEVLLKDTDVTALSKKVESVLDDD